MSETETIAAAGVEGRARAGRAAPLLRALRAHQWVKNLLVFAPLLLAHRVFEAEPLLRCAGAFAAWSLCASGGYLFNDLLDAEADRRHPYKMRRPLAAGALGRGAAAWAALALVAAGLAPAVLWLPARFGLMLGLYLALTVAYTALLKRLVIVDVLVLAGLYTLRVLAGGFAAGVEVSPWLLAFSMFLFLSLAFVKRYTELRAANGASPARRGYTAEDTELLKSFGTTAGYLSVLVLALYINQSREVTHLYRRPEALWLIGPCLLYWVTRVWLLARRGRLHDDPVVFTVKDPASYAVGAVIVLLAIVATV
ncbi:MAG TPA: UbiA family prenyltransferase [Pyrinomonadaceae bacterium]|nr:UbiA family prenyltransferase [Pyrinomonadaceae bacterium]